MSDILFKCFTDNRLKANPEKSHLLTNFAQEIQINIGGLALSISKCEKLLVIHIDKKLTFKPHVRSLAFLIRTILELFAREGCKFFKK